MWVVRPSVGRGEDRMLDHEACYGNISRFDGELMAAPGFEALIRSKQGGRRFSVLYLLSRFGAWTPAASGVYVFDWKT